MDEIEKYLKKAEAGDPVAQRELGLALKDTDKVASVTWLKKAANQGDAIAQYHFSVVRFAFAQDSEDEKDALDYLQKSAAQNYAPAQHMLGIIYFSGQYGVTENFDVAINWIKKAAEQNYAESELFIGITCSKKGTQLGVKEAFPWFLRAAEHGQAKAQCIIAKYYYIKGFGDVQRDCKKAIEWYEKSANQNYAEAQAGLGKIYLVGVDNIAPDLNKAIYWIKKAVEQDDSEAEYLFAGAYATGTGVAKDSCKAIEWAEKSAKHGFAAAQHMMAIGYVDGVGGLTRDLDKATYWLNKAIEQNYQPAIEYEPELKQKKYSSTIRTTPTAPQNNFATNRNDATETEEEKPPVKLSVEEIGEILKKQKKKNLIWFIVGLVSILLMSIHFSFIVEKAPVLYIAFKVTMLLILSILNGINAGILILVNDRYQYKILNKQPEINLFTVIIVLLGGIIVPLLTIVYYKKHHKDDEDA